jgi:hypothetical protein
MTEHNRVVVVAVKVGIPVFLVAFLAFALKRTTIEEDAGRPGVYDVFRPGHFTRSPTGKELDCHAVNDTFVRRCCTAIFSERQQRRGITF